MTASDVILSSTDSSSATSSRSGLRIALWTAQVLLAAVFGLAGAIKVFTPIAELAAKMRGVNLAPGLVRFIGASELAGALGIVLPALTRVRPKLTVLAALGLATVMVLASAFHLYRGEPQELPVTITLGGLAVFVAWGRFRKAPIKPR